MAGNDYEPLRKFLYPSERMDEYYKKFIELQEKLRKSEEERLELEIKFNEMVRVTREEEQTHYRRLRAQYKRFLEEDRRRQERNESLIRALDRVEARASTLACKTERVNFLRKQYQAYMKRINTTQPLKISEELDAQSAKNLYEHPAIKKVLEKNGKNEIIEKYLQSVASPKRQVSPFTLTKDYIEEFRRELHDEVGDSYTPRSAITVADEIMSSIYSKRKNKEGDFLQDHHFENHNGQLEGNVHDQKVTKRPTTFLPQEEEAVFNGFKDGENVTPKSFTNVGEESTKKYVKTRSISSPEELATPPMIQRVVLHEKENKRLQNGNNADALAEHLTPVNVESSRVQDTEEQQDGRLRNMNLDEGYDQLFDQPLQYAQEFEDQQSNVQQYNDLTEEQLQEIHGQQYDDQDHPVQRDDVNDEELAEHFSGQFTEQTGQYIDHDRIQMSQPGNEDDEKVLQHNGQSKEEESYDEQSQVLQNYNEQKQTDSTFNDGHQNGAQQNNQDQYYEQISQESHQQQVVDDHQGEFDQNYSDQRLIDPNVNDQTQLGQEQFVQQQVQEYHGQEQEANYYDDQGQYIQNNDEQRQTDRTLDDQTQLKQEEFVPQDNQTRLGQEQFVQQHNQEYQGQDQEQEAGYYDDHGQYIPNYDEQRQTDPTLGDQTQSNQEQFAPQEDKEQYYQQPQQYQAQDGDHYGDQTQPNYVDQHREQTDSTVNDHDQFDGQSINQYENYAPVEQPQHEYVDPNAEYVQQYENEAGQYAQYDENGQPLQYDNQQFQGEVDPQQYYDESTGQYQYDQAGVAQYDETGQPMQYYAEDGAVQGAGSDVNVNEEAFQENSETQKAQNVMNMLDTDTESFKQDTKTSNDSDFDVSNN